MKFICNFDRWYCEIDKNELKPIKETTMDMTLYVDRETEYSDSEVIEGAFSALRINRDTENNDNIDLKIKQTDDEVFSRRKGRGAFAYFHSVVF